MEIKITKTSTKKQKPDQTKLGFGNYYTDHMFIQWCCIMLRRFSRA